MNAAICWPLVWNLIHFFFFLLFCWPSSDSTMSLFSGNHTPLPLVVVVVLLLLLLLPLSAVPCTICAFFYFLLSRL